jgi:hypothetical protein
MTISLEECRKCLSDCNLNDEEIIQIRSTLEVITHSILDNLFREKHPMKNDETHIERNNEDLNE